MWGRSRHAGPFSGGGISWIPGPTFGVADAGAGEALGIGRAGGRVHVLASISMQGAWLGCAVCVNVS